MPRRRLIVSTQTYRTHKPFKIARGIKSEAVQVIVEISDGIHIGRGACVPYGRYGETVDGVISAIESARPQIEQGRDKELTQNLHGAARNGVECAQIDFLAEEKRMPVWAMYDIPEPTPKPTAITISVDNIETMARDAAEKSKYDLIKVKLAGNADDLTRVKAVMHAAPKAKFILDANESMTRASLDFLSANLNWNRIALIEQPLPAGNESDLEGYQWRDYLCADESFHHSTDIKRLISLYGAVNIKLDKSGGFSGAMSSASAARAADMKVMLGCMLGSSLAMAPAFMLSGLADFLDLDGPLLLKDDDPDGFAFHNGLMMPCRIWGIPTT